MKRYCCLLLLLSTTAAAEERTPRPSQPTPSANERAAQLARLLAELRQLREADAAAKRRFEEQKRELAARQKAFQRVNQTRQEALAQAETCRKKEEQTAAELRHQLAELRRQAAELKGYLNRALEGIRQRIAAGICWQREERLAGIDAALKIVGDERSSPYQALSTVAAVFAEEEALGRLVEAGKLLRGDVAYEALRLGRLAVLAVSGDGREGFSAPAGAVLERALPLERKLLEGVRQAIEVLRRRRAPHLVWLPLVFSPQPPATELPPLPVAEPPPPAPVAQRRDLSPPSPARTAAEESPRPAEASPEEPAPQPLVGHERKTPSLAEAIAVVEAELKEQRRLNAARAEYRARRLGTDYEKLARLEKRRSALETAINQSESESARLAEENAQHQERRKQAEEELRDFDAALAAQLAQLAERLKGSLLALEMPHLPGRARRLGGFAPPERGGALREYLQLVAEVLARSEGVSRFSALLRLASGRVREVRVVRVGEVAAYFAVEGEAGLVRQDPESDGGWMGEARGLSWPQQEAVAAFVGALPASARVPFDVTGGAALARARSEHTLVEWFLTGGPIMYFILLVGVLGVALVLERLVVLAPATYSGERGTARITALCRGSRLAAVEKEAAAAGALGRILRVSLAHRESAKEDLEQAIQEAVLQETPRLQARLGALALLAGVAPLLGLLGTVTGMIETFRMVTLFGAGDPRFLAGGISEALITTEFGLLIAVPLLLFHGLFQGMSDRALGRIEQGAALLVGVLGREKGNVGGAAERKDA